MLTDSHCHFYLAKTPAADWLARAEEMGVNRFLNVSVDEETMADVLLLAQRDARVWASAGIHPNTPTHHEPNVAALCALADHTRVVAIGEAGLDYYHPNPMGGSDWQWQHERFRRHIRAAREMGKPLIVHSRDAKADVLRLLREEQAHTVGGVMHCFVDDWDTAQQAMDMNFYISFSGIVTFKTATALQNVAQQVPADRLLIETDSPYLAPAPYRGKANQPAYVRHVADFVAQLREAALVDIAACTNRNFERLFRVPPCDALPLATSHA